MPTRLNSRMMGRVTATGLPGTGASQPKYRDDDAGDEDPENDQELALRQQVGLAGLVDQLGDLAHGRVDGEIAKPGIHHEAEDEAERGDAHTEHQERAPSNPEERHCGEVGQHQACFAAVMDGLLFLRHGRRGQIREHEKAEEKGERNGKIAP